MPTSWSERLERWQIAVYLPAVAAGLALGVAWPAGGALAAKAVWPAVALLLFATFLGLPLRSLGRVMRHRRYLAALLLGNFVVVPLLVVALVSSVHLEPAVRLAVALVLLAPCTDWFTAFAHLGGGDGRLALASTPWLLLVQVVAVPLWAWVVAGDAAFEVVRAEAFLFAFLGMVALPLALAALVQTASPHLATARRAVQHGPRAAVPLLAAVLLLVATAEAPTVLQRGHELLPVAGLFAAYLALAPLLGTTLAKLLRLPPAAARTLIYSFGTRNSFVIFPLVLAATGHGSLAVVAVVMQSLVELLGMLVYMALLRPRAGRPPLRHDGLLAEEE